MALTRSVQRTGAKAGAISPESFVRSRDIWPKAIRHVALSGRVKTCARFKSFPDRVQGTQERNEQNESKINEESKHKSSRPARGHQSNGSSRSASYRIGEFINISGRGGNSSGDAGSFYRPLHHSFRRSMCRPSTRSNIDFRCCRVFSEDHHEGGQQWRYPSEHGRDCFRRRY